MTKHIFSYLIIASFFILIAGCKKDNFDPPSSFIKGRVVYQSQPIGVRSNGVQLELWQSGFQLFSKVVINVAQDGTFSANVFDGNYKITRLKGNGPWADNTDTIQVSLTGTANVDVPIDPYFIIKNETFKKNGTNIDATFNIQRVNTTKTLELARIYLGQTIIVDQTNNAANAQKAAAVITDLTQPVTLTIPIPASLAGKDYLFARVGVKTTGVTELVYSQVIEIPLK
jgi:hypothetical protein